MKQFNTRLSALAAAAIGVLAAPAYADSISFASLAGYYGTDSAYTGTLDVTGSTLTITLNTTGSSGYLTAIAFNATGGAITGLTSGPANFKAISPAKTGFYGQYSDGAAIGNLWHHAGDAANGVAVGSSATFVYSLSGSGFDSSDFWSESCNTVRNLCGSFVARFRGIDGVDTGDKVTAAVVPEPETYALMLAGLTVVGFVARRRRSA